jgi:hypothetical protein
MRPTEAIHPAARSARRRLAGDIRRAVLASGLVVALCAAVGFFAIKMRPQSQTFSEADLRTGSMVIVNPVGDVCQERTIDNDTWRIHNGGLVDCSEALAKAAAAGANSGGQWSGSRVDIIRKGFRHQP